MSKDHTENCGEKIDIRGLIPETEEILKRKVTSNIFADIISKYENAKDTSADGIPFDDIVGSSASSYENNYDSCSSENSFVDNDYVSESELDTNYIEEQLVEVREKQKQDMNKMGITPDMLKGNYFSEQAEECVKRWMASRGLLQNPTEYITNEESKEVRENSNQKVEIHRKQEFRVTNGDNEDSMNSVDMKNYILSSKNSSMKIQKTVIKTTTVRQLRNENLKSLSSYIPAITTGTLTTSKATSKSDSECDFRSIPQIKNFKEWTKPPVMQYNKFHDESRRKKYRKKAKKSFLSPEYQLKNRWLEESSEDDVFDDDTLEKPNKSQYRALLPKKYSIPLEKKQCEKTLAIMPKVAEKNSQPKVQDKTLTTRPFNIVVQKLDSKLFNENGYKSEKLSWVPNERHPLHNGAIKRNMDDQNINSLRNHKNQYIKESVPAENLVFDKQEKEIPSIQLSNAAIARTKNSESIEQTSKVPLIREDNLPQVESKKKEACLLKSNVPILEEQVSEPEPVLLDNPSVKSNKSEEVSPLMEDLLVNFNKQEQAQLKRQLPLMLNELTIKLIRKEEASQMEAQVPALLDDPPVKTNNKEEIKSHEAVLMKDQLVNLNKKEEAPQLKRQLPVLLDGAKSNRKKRAYRRKVQVPVLLDDLPAKFNKKEIKANEAVLMKDLLVNLNKKEASQLKRQPPVLLDGAKSNRKKRAYRRKVQMPVLLDDLPAKSNKEEIKAHKAVLIKDQPVKSKTNKNKELDQMKTQVPVLLDDLLAKSNEKKEPIQMKSNEAVLMKDLPVESKKKGKSGQILKDKRPATSNKNEEPVQIKDQFPDVIKYISTKSGKNAEPDQMNDKVSVSIENTHTILNKKNEPIKMKSQVIEDMPTKLKRKKPPGQMKVNNPILMEEMPEKSNKKVPGQLKSMKKGKVDSSAKIKNKENPRVVYTTEDDDWYDAKSEASNEDGCEIKSNRLQKTSDCRDDLVNMIVPLVRDCKIEKKHQKTRNVSEKEKSNLKEKKTLVMISTETRNENPEAIVNLVSSSSSSSSSSSGTDKIRLFEADKAEEVRNKKQRLQLISGQQSKVPENKKKMQKPKFDEFKKESKNRKKQFSNIITLSDGSELNPKEPERNNLLNSKHSKKITDEASRTNKPNQRFIEDGNAANVQRPTKNEKNSDLISEKTNKKKDHPMNTITEMIIVDWSSDSENNITIVQRHKNDEKNSKSVKTYPGKSKNTKKCTNYSKPLTSNKNSKKEDSPPIERLPSKETIQNSTEDKSSFSYSSESTVVEVNRKRNQSKTSVSPKKVSQSSSDPEYLPSRAWRMVNNFKSPPKKKHGAKLKKKRRNDEKSVLCSTVHNKQQNDFMSIDTTCELSNVFTLQNQQIANSTEIKFYSDAENTRKINTQPAEYLDEGLVYVFCPEFHFKGAPADYKHLVTENMLDLRNVAEVDHGQFKNFKKRIHINSKIVFYAKQAELARKYLKEEEDSDHCDVIEQAILQKKLFRVEEVLAMDHPNSKIDIDLIKKKHPEKVPHYLW